MRLSRPARDHQGAAQLKTWVVERCCAAAAAAAAVEEEDEGKSECAAAARAGRTTQSFEVTSEPSVVCTPPPPNPPAHPQRLLNSRSLLKNPPAHAMLHETSELARVTRVLLTYVRVPSPPSPTQIRPNLLPHSSIGRGGDGDGSGARSFDRVSPAATRRPFALSPSAC